jgi:TATA-box binding protein (TBP) (component of TFIID and TFIIIB)
MNEQGVVVRIVGPKRAMVVLESGKKIPAWNFDQVDLAVGQAVTVDTEQRVIIYPDSQ